MDKIPDTDKETQKSLHRLYSTKRHANCVTDENERLSAYKAI